MCKIVKGEDNPEWKKNDTEDCRSNSYYSKGMAGSSEKSELDYKRSRKGKYNKSYAIKRSTIRKEV